MQPLLLNSPYASLFFPVAHQSYYCFFNFPLIFLFLLTSMVSVFSVLLQLPCPGPSLVCCFPATMSFLVFSHSWKSTVQIPCKLIPYFSKTSSSPYSSVFVFHKKGSSPKSSSFLQVELVSTTLYFFVRALGCYGLYLQ